MKFTKMHGCGNDYVYVNCFEETVVNPKELAIRVSDRHFGIGSDGLILIKPSDVADFEMQMFNADGSEGAMCGNGIRCVGKYVYDRGMTDQTRLAIETKAGLKKLLLYTESGKTVSVSVEMGRISVGQPAVLQTKLGTYTCVPADAGNPHTVIFCEDAESVPVSRIGPMIEKHPAFPNGTNVEFVQDLGQNRVRMRVWERGSGITLACGTGACAAAAAAVGKGLCQRGEPVTMILDGGELKIMVSDDGSAVMTGPAEFVYEGETDIC